MKYRKAYPDPEPAETPEKTEGPQAPTPFLLYCRKKRQTISWCKKEFPSLSDKEKLKWIDLALAQEASYIVILLYL